MEARLVRNLAHMLRRRGVRFRIRREGGRVFIYADRIKDALEATSRSFGVVSASPAMEVDASLDAIRDAVVRHATSVLKPGRTFAIRARRLKTFPHTSKELERLLGECVLKSIKGVRVDLTSPDVTIYVEARERRAYVFSEVVRGPGGLPYGVEGRVVALVSGGTDSAVAAWLIMKRGAEVVPVFNDMGRFISEAARKRALEVLRRLREWVPEGEWRVYIVPFWIVHEAINGLDERYRCLLCKVAMYKVAELIAEVEGAKALATGESLGQVASQTLDNIHAMSVLVGLPILRPLIGLDKCEIEDLARKVNIYEVAAKDVGGCALVPAHPVTRARPEDIRSLVEKYGVDGLVKRAFERSSVLEL